MLQLIGGYFWPGVGHRRHTRYRGDQGLLGFERGVIDIGIQLPQADRGSLITDKSSLLVPSHRHSADERIKCTQLAAGVVQQKLDRFRAKKGQREDVFDVAMGEAMLAGQIGQSRRLTVNNQVVPGTSSGDGFRDRFPARLRN